jgi:hypothetical protein
LISGGKFETKTIQKAKFETKRIEKNDFFVGNFKKVNFEALPCQKYNTSLYTTKYFFYQDQNSLWAIQHRH